MRSSIDAFLDTSVLIAANDSDHPNHEDSHRLLSAAVPQNTACAAHSLAEVYAVLSRMPGGKRQRPELAGILVDQIIKRMTVVSLTADEYAETIRRAVQAKIAGGTIFDALLLACARKVDAEHIYTWNLRHFHLVAPDLAGRILSPQIGMP
jgi:predicted nucleic acid-binding protein